jgi:DNA-binding transcriptional MerR regulator
MDLLLVSDVARALGCGVDQVRNLERRGKLRASRTPNGTRLFAPEDVARLIVERPATKARRTRRV